MSVNPLANKEVPKKSWDDEFRELTLQFIARLPIRIAEMETALERGNLEQVAAVAHKLSGAAGSYSISELALEARQLESTSLRKDLTTAHKSLEKIKLISTDLTKTELPEKH